MRFQDSPKKFWGHARQTEDGCLLWQGAKTEDGYGYFRARNGGVHLCHRHAWELMNGSIPPGLCVLHRCDVPSCINIDHLFLGTPQDNMRDMVNKGRASVRPGESNPRAYLTYTLVKEMRILFDNGMSTTDVARHYGIPRSTASNVVYRYNWRKQNGNT